MAKSTDIPQRSRDAVHARDRGKCRVCGQNADPAALHHITYRSQERNNHDPSNLVTLGQAYGHICHQMVHAHPNVFREALEAIVDTPNITALRWLRRRGVDITGLRRGSL